MCTRTLLRLLGPLAICWLLPSAVMADESPAPLATPSIVYKVQNASERLEMTVNTSRILTMDQKIPQVQTTNPKVLELTPISPTQIQISAKDVGVSQVNLWGEDKKVSTIDVLVLGDVRELQLILQTTFPNAALKVTPVKSTAMISGFVDKPEHVERIIRIAEEYYPKVINNMTVGGCQQVLLHVKVMEVSRTKLRQLGLDWAKITGSNVITSGPNGLITDYTDEYTPLAKAAIRSATTSTFAFNVVNGANGFFGVLDALRRDNLMKIMSEPTLVTISGRAATFSVGGKVAIPVVGSLGTTGITYEPFGTKIEFVPMVLGNGKIQLEVRSEVSETDYTNGTIIANTAVPGFKSRKVDTGVELMAGQTLAIAGLVQTRVEAENAGLPWISEVPYLGAAFRSVNEKINEVELIIMVTPELVEAMNADEVPPGGPGMNTTSPSDWELYMKGHLEVPNCCPMGGPCNGDFRPDGAGGLPPEGMILDPAEQIPAPVPADAAGHPLRKGLGTVARRGGNPGARAGAERGRPYNRYASPKPNSSQKAAPAESRSGPPGFIGPVGYDVVK